MRSLIVAVTVALLSHTALAADPTPRIITTSGSAERRIVPDEAHVNVNAGATNPKLETAKAEHDRKLRDIIAIAKKAGVDEAQIKTQHSSVQPQYSYENNKQNFRGYLVQTSLDITVKKIDAVGGLIEKLTSAKLENGAGQDWSGLMNVSYSVSDPDKVRDEMLADAIRNARLKAERMAAAAGAKIGRVAQINEGGAPQFAFPQPMMAMARAGGMEKAADMAVAPPPGEQQVNANVTVSFELKD